MQYRQAGFPCNRFSPFQNSYILDWSVFISGLKFRFNNHRQGLSSRTHNCPGPASANLALAGISFLEQIPNCFEMQTHSWIYDQGSSQTGHHSSIVHRPHIGTPQRDPFWLKDDFPIPWSSPREKNHSSIVEITRKHHISLMNFFIG